MTETSTTTDTAEKPTPLPFSPLTTAEISVRIDRLGMHYYSYAINHHLHHDPTVRAEAALVIELCRARTDRVVANLRRSAA